jgi:hypothetical protein
MALFLGNLFHKWGQDTTKPRHLHNALRTQFDTFAGKLPGDIVNKIMSFWSPGYPFLEEIKWVFPKIVKARIAFADGDGDEEDEAGRWINGIIRGVINTTHIIRPSTWMRGGRWERVSRVVMDEAWILTSDGWKCGLGHMGI